ncbi:unnamed protein product [Leptidea sinapis]|uniref:FP protein C-terminal domain-containing protein n=1 Tax=Leptidea sinapis TaxID=189913 RepID=A0A5E4PLS9_9NEOP|nr:unnamed protein product [Leptidea sinapis]
MSLQRTPPTAIKCASNPDLYTPSTSIISEANSNIRKRKQPSDLDSERIEIIINQKIENNIKSWNEKIDTLITSSIMNTVRSVLSSELKNISETLTNINDSIRGLRADNIIMKKSMDEMNLRFSKMEESINFCDERQKDLEKRLVSLEKRSASCNNFSEQVSTLEQKIASMEQQARDCNIEITNVPERRGESLVQLVVKLGTMVNQPVTTKDIVVAHRVPHADAKDYRPKNIIVKEMAKKHEYKHVWCKHGTILVRKTDVSPVLVIKNDNDVNKLTK